MKTLTILLTLLTFNAFASHTYSCDIEAEVKSISLLDKLNDTTTLITHSNIMRDEREVVATITLKKANGTGRYNCPYSAGEEVTLYVNKVDQNSFKAGEKLTLRYSSFGNRGSSQISWSVL